MKSKENSVMISCLREECIMKKMKRILSLLLMGILVLSLCACGKKDGEKGDKQKNEVRIKP